MARRAALSLARNVGKTLTYKTLYEDVTQGDTPGNADAGMFRKALGFLRLAYIRFVRRIRRRIASVLCYE
jgi:hypothetical protein